MKLKIKSSPEDFHVEEIATLALEKRGPFAVYHLEKRGWNTVDALFEIARQLKVPFENFSYGGKKDRHAVTSQWVTFKGRKVPEIVDKAFTLKFRGFSDRPMGPDLIEGNRFQIAVRALTAGQAESASAEICRVKEFGYPNYFDDQRFGSFDPVQGFIAEKLLKKHFNGALKIYLTSLHSEGKKSDKERKKYFFEHWKDWDACLKMATTGFERKAFEFLQKQPAAFLPVLKEIPRENMSLYLSAYQSYLWNDLARRLIRARVPSGLQVYPGVAGEYLFYRDLSRDVFSYLKGLVLPTPAGNAKMPDEESAGIYQAILASRGITKTMFTKLKIRESYFKATPRPLVMRPEDLNFRIEPDEACAGKMKLLLQFTLKRGSYGTMLLKKLFCDDGR